jgi:HSP20 family protein
MIRWEPFREMMAEMAAIREEMDRLFEEVFGRAERIPITRRLYIPVDLREEDAEFKLRAAIPGARPEDIEVSVERQTLTIRGRIPEWPEEPGKRVSYLLREVPAGEFSRTIMLPIPVDPDQAEARFENGMLWLRLPKAPEVRPRRISVQVGGALPAGTPTS